MTQASERVAVVIPTKNRPHDLDITLESLLAQTVLPFQVIIIDQSSAEDSHRCVQDRWDKMDRQIGLQPELIYRRDTSIAGVSPARNVALPLVRAEIILFLDDDVIMEPDFIEQLLIAYVAHPEASGISGIVSNYTPPSRAFRLWTRIFMTGPFWDDRQPVYWNSDKLRESKPIRVTRFGGGLMSFRTTAVRGASFDPNLRDGEDIDYCLQLGKGATLLITSRARLVHNSSPIGRNPEHWLAKHARTMSYLYWRHWNHHAGNRLRFLWLNMGYAVVAAAVSIRRWSFQPLKGVARSNRESRSMAGFAG